MKYQDWLSDWLDNYVRSYAKQRTYERYYDIVRLHIVPCLGDYELKELSIEIMQKFVTMLSKQGNKKTGKGLAANTVGSIINVLQSSLKSAYYVGYTEKYVADRIKRPKMQEKPIECFSPLEQKQIEQEILNSKSYKMYGIILCLYSGVRIGELLAIEWDDIDWVKGLLTIAKSCHDSKDGEGKYLKIIEAPKTYTSRRIIPLPKQFIPILRMIKKESMSRFVVASGERDVSVRSYQRSFDLLLRRLNIPHRGFHSLRHTFATRALECGMDIKTLSEILGHKSPTVTLTRYAHSLLEHKQDMMNRVGKLL